MGKVGWGQLQVWRVVSVWGRKGELALKGEEESTVSAGSRRVLMTVLFWKDRACGDVEGGWTVRGEDGGRELVPQWSLVNVMRAWLPPLQTGCSNPASKAHSSTCSSTVSVLAISCWFSCLHFLSACQIFYYIQESFKHIEASLREGIKKTRRRDHTLPRDTQDRWGWWRDKGRPEEIGLVVTNQSPSRLSWHLSFTIHWLCDHRQVTSLRLGISHL